MLKCLAFIACNFFTNAVSGQLSNDITLIESDTVASNKDFRNHPQSKLQTKGSAFKILGGSIVFMYQHFVSDQFQPECIFTPSCSSFGRQSLEKTNFLNAIWIMGDRMTRCSHMNAAYYSNEPIINGLIADPVENYLLQEKK